MAWSLWDAMDTWTVGAGVLMALLVTGLCELRRRSRYRQRPVGPASGLSLGGDPQRLTRLGAMSQYSPEPFRFLRARAVKLLVDGREAFPEMLAAIAGATRRIDLETYLLHADVTGLQFQQALCHAALRGVRVRLLYDWVGSMGLPDSYVRELLGAGVSVAVYRPLFWTRPSWAFNRRDHRKILVVDGQVAFTGGLNISDDYATRQEGGKGWRDTHVRLEGREVCRRLLQVFLTDWRRAVPYAKSVTAGSRLGNGLRRHLQQALRSRRKAGRVGPLEPQDGVPVQILGNQELRYRYRIRRAYLHAIRRAKRYILIENAYFIPDGRVRRALTQAARRGVTVGVVVARQSDVAVVAYASRFLYDELLRSGVRLFEWPSSMMHAKTAVIDDAWSIVGSYNFDHRSLMHQLEVVAVIAEPSFAEILRDQTLTDMSRCREVTPESRRQGSRPGRLVEAFCYLLRYWL